MFKNLEQKIISYGIVFLVGLAAGLILKSGDTQKAFDQINLDKYIQPKTIVVTATPIPAVGNNATVKVVKIVDGDTIKISTGHTVRYIGINTPETKDPTKGVECFGAEASQYNKTLVEGRMVRLEKDVSETDRYGRLLRYVYLQPIASGEPEVFVNNDLVARGYAYASSYPPDVKNDAIFQESQRNSMDAGNGLWTACPR